MTTLYISIEAVPTFIFVMKPWQHSTLALALALKLHQYLHWGRANVQHFIRTEAMKLCQQFICTEAVPTFIFVMKPRQHSTLALVLALKSYHHLHWSHFNIHLYHKAMSTLHSYRSHVIIHLWHEATSTLHFCHEATTILHSHWSRANVHLCHEVMTTLHISTNFQRQHSLDIEGA